MRLFLPILVLVGCAWAQAGDQSQTAPAAAATPAQAPNPADENSRKARELIDQAITALGGPTYLTIRDRVQQGRGYGFHHGRAEGGGNLFWDFIEFPDKERVEITKERDIAQLYVGNKAWEITFKGPHPIDPKDLDQYLRRRHFSLDAVLRTWINEPGVVLLYEGNAIAAQHPAQRVTLINAQNESVTLFFDNDTHLPVKKSFEWRDPVDRQKNLEEEVYENYRAVSGISAPYNVTRYFNGDMASQRFFNSVAINQGLDPAMFDPNSGYNPNKPGKGKK
ncbi:MAG TPA: hypothetical protein VFA67_09450 [Candidatus Sulfotelmatobacter sp.]|nr:hypothetical protein [Candidatus Sulfotelmatobacter sp.]